MRTTVLRILPVALTAAFISACADTPTSTVGFTPSLHVIPVAAPHLEQVALCKAGPVGTYTFDATATHPVLRNEGAAGTFDLTAATYTIVVSAGSTIDVGGTQVPGACYSFGALLHNHIALASGGIDATVTIVESGIPAGVDFDHVDVYQNTAGTVTSSSSTTNSASAHVGGTGGAATLGAGIVFYNVAEPTGNQGCTPGYWKQDQHFDSWTGYAPGDDFDATFGVDLFNPDISLLDALNLTGGKGGKNQLARAAVAALLNAAEGFSPMTEAQVIAAVQAAATSGDFESTKNTFAANNELGCPLN